MKADELLNWDKADLADFLADKMSDAEDLAEAIPSIEEPGVQDDPILTECIQKNWREILSRIDVEDIGDWINSKDEAASYARFRKRGLEQEIEDAEMEYYWSLIEQMYQFRDMDLAERRGYPSRFRKS